MRRRPSAALRGEEAFDGGTKRTVRMNARVTSPNVFVSADIEGCATLVHWDEVLPSADIAYERARWLMTGEVNAVLAGAFAAGAANAVVNDSHSRMRNLIAGDVDTSATVVTGRLKPLYMLEGIAAGAAPADAAFFLGYHGAINDAAAVMAHTYSPRLIFELRLNGEPVGEVTINAALAGHFGVPVALVTGDQATIAEARRNLPWAVGVQTKTSIGYFAADCLSPAAVCDALRDGARRAIEDLVQMQIYLLPAPVVMELDTLRASQADALELIPGMQRRAARTVAFRADDFASIYRAMTAAIHIGTAA
jgi:D-amino peptidase